MTSAKLTRNLSILGLLTGMLFSSGCEPDEPKHTKRGVEGHADVYGTWYKSEAGTTPSGRRWHWGYIYLHQKGTNVWGTARWERYSPEEVRGYVNGNRLYLENKESPKTFEGEVRNDVFNTTYRFFSEGEFYSLRKRYTRISEDIPKEYY